MNSFTKKIAIIGGGPSALFLLKQLLEKNDSNFSLDIFERRQELGPGMPYSNAGSCTEHLANVSANEIPPLPESVPGWIMTQSSSLLKKFDFNKDHFHEYKVLPRLLLGKYLSDQFHLLIEEAKRKKIGVRIHLSSSVTDIITGIEDDTINVEVNKSDTHRFDTVIICTGHHWHKKKEEKHKGYFDSPYPPEKLKFKANFPIAIRGSSLTAIDAIRTLSRQHGQFVTNASNQLTYQCDDSFPHFKIVMHSIDGLLPAIRFHLDDPQLSAKGLLSEEEIKVHRKQNNGFVSLDYLFEKDFKVILKKKDPALYDLIKEMNMEAFVETVMRMRERIHPFLLFKAEYDEAIHSIDQKKSVYWKELLSILSGALNYPAKYLCAEDMLRLKEVLLPLISIVIASVPQSSCLELLALHEAAKLDIVSVDNNSKVVPQIDEGVMYQYIDEGGNHKQDHYQLFIDCIGQQQLSTNDFPFKSLVKNDGIKQASLQFRSVEKANQLLEQGVKDVYCERENEYYLKVPGIAITDSFQIIDKHGDANSQLYIMAVPFISGFNPDYSGLGFCNETAEKIVAHVVSKNKIAQVAGA